MSPEGAVKHQQRHAKRRRKPCRAATEAARLEWREFLAKNVQEDEARHPAELRYIKNVRRGIEQQQIQRPVECAEGKATVETQQKKIRLPAASPVEDTRKQRTDE